MEPALQILTAISLGLLCIALALWGILLLYRALDNRARIRRAHIADRWLLLLLPVLEEDAMVESLPQVRKAEELEAVLALLRDLAERFRGQYLTRLQTILTHIGGERYGQHMLQQKGLVYRLRGCALLAWTAPNAQVDGALLRVLQTDARRVVRIEAAHALAMRRTQGIRLTVVLEALRAVDALRSERVRDILRLMAPGRGAELKQLLPVAQSPREKVLLLDSLSVAGELELTDLAAQALPDPTPSVRAAAVLTLERLADPAHLQAVANLAQDPDYRVRLAVAKYAISMGNDPMAVDVLKQLAVDTNFDVQRVAVRGLAASGNPRWQDNIPTTSTNPQLLAALVDEAAAALPA